ncbi:hypothetical protein BDF19DRAFT_412949 [Syncephalis fuscata]|nr:hypothetical protein BDF19DRAFT_412949 [Syncephalis fuscata]
MLWIWCALAFRRWQTLVLFSSLFIVILGQSAILPNPSEKQNNIVSQILGKTVDLFDDTLSIYDGHLLDELSQLQPSSTLLNVDKSSTPMASPTIDWVVVGTVRFDELPRSPAAENTLTSTVNYSNGNDGNSNDHSTSLSSSPKPSISALPTPSLRDENVWPWNVWPDLLELLPDNIRLIDSFPWSESSSNNLDDMELINDP